MTFTVIMVLLTNLLVNLPGILLIPKGISSQNRVFICPVGSFYLKKIING